MGLQPEGMPRHRGEAESRERGAAVCYDCELIAATFSPVNEMVSPGYCCSNSGKGNGERGRAIKSKRVSCQASSRGWQTTIEMKTSALRALRIPPVDRRGLRKWKWQGRVSVSILGALRISDISPSIEERILCMQLHNWSLIEPIAGHTIKSQSASIQTEATLRISAISLIMLPWTKEDT